MTMLYHIATIYNGLVVVEIVEDFGIGYFTKYGDGGVDISPLAEFTKSEVISMAKSLGILPEITNAYLVTICGKILNYLENLCQMNLNLAHTPNWNG